MVLVDVVRRLGSGMQFVLLARLSVDRALRSRRSEADASHRRAWSFSKDVVRGAEMCTEPAKRDRPLRTAIDRRRLRSEVFVSVETATRWRSGVSAPAAGGVEDDRADSVS